MKRPTVILPKSKHLTEPARRLLSKALNAMVRYPETVDMGTWLDHDEDVKATRKRPKPYCGTVACLAGHIVIAGNLRVPDEDYSLAAAEALGLSIDDEIRLFSWRNEALDEEYPKDFRAQARAVVNRVKHWVRTGE